MSFLFQCLSAEEIYQKMNLPKYCAMQPKQFQEICPSLIFQLSQKSCEKTKESLSQAGASAGASKFFSFHLQHTRTAVTE